MIYSATKCIWKHKNIPSLSWITSKKQSRCRVFFI